MPLITAPNFDAGDDFYEALLAAHQGLDAAASAAFNARLILLMANHICRQDVLLEALAAAGRANPVSTSTSTSPATTATAGSATSSDPVIAPTPGTASPRGPA